MARENENKCLNVIKDAILGKNNINVYSNCSLKEIMDYIFSAVGNANYNDFPDFVFDGGGIEHFELTSSKESKKGSEFKIEESKNKQIREKYEEKIREDFLNSKHVPDTFSTFTVEETYDSFTYEDFLSSLKRNISNHVDSLIKNHYEDKIVIFLMEQQTARMWIDEGMIPIRFYELHRDKRALSIMKDLCNSVKYLIYSAADSIEIIDLSKLDSLIDKSVIYKKVMGGRLIDESITILWDL